MTNLGKIYCYHCISTGKKYIGQTIQEETRKQRHLTDSKRLYCKFYNAVRKYGWDNFIYGIVDEYDIRHLDEREMYFIDFYDTYRNGYNMTLGGQGRKKYDLVFETSSEYYKFYKENNIERIKEKNKKHYQNTKSKKKEYYEKNKDTKLEYLVEWRKNNKDKIKKYSKDNREKLREYNKLYYQKRKQRTLEELSNQIANLDKPGV